MYKLMVPESIEESSRICKFFTLKYIFRFLHLLSVIFLFGDASYNLFFGRRPQDDGSRLTLTIVTSVVLILAGFGNMITMIFEKTYNKEDCNYKAWKIALYCKTAIAFFLTPVLDKIVQAAVTEVKNQADIARFVLMLVAYSGSVFIRYYREYYMKPVQVVEHHNEDVALEGNR